MRTGKNLRDRYIQLVETFITAIENGRSGAELEDIRNEIRILSTQLASGSSVENHTQQFDILTLKQNIEYKSKSNGIDSIIN